MSSTGSDRSFLDQRLADLLGFEDGVTDVVEHLLSIESSEDLKDYLSQLLGSSNPEAIDAFVQDVGKYQRGEPLLVSSLQTKAPPPSSEASTSAPPTQNSVQKNNDKQTNSKKKPNVAKAVHSKSKNQKKKGPTVTNENAGAPPVSEPAPSSFTKKPPKKKPPKGKAPYTCGCFGTRHKALTNCLYCGRIACAREGYNFCPFCGYWMEEPDASGRRPDSVSEQAWELKQTLLRFDKDSAQRTQVVDDQEDYYHSGDAWLNQEEQATSAERESERKNALHRRQNMQLNVGL